MTIAALELGFALASPSWLWLLLAAGATVLWRFRQRQRQRVVLSGVMVDAVSGAGELARVLDCGPMPRSWWQRFVSSLPWLEGAALGLTVIALARPIERVPLPPEREGADVLLCLDISSSMLAEDLGAGERSRLSVVLTAAAEFLARRGADRVGIVTFARYADLVCPPTLDHRAAASLLADVVPVEADGPEDATGIGTALSFCIEALERGVTAGKVVVLLTDGEENVATRAAPQEIAPLHAAQLAAQLGVRVHTIAAGAGRAAGGGSSDALDTTIIQQVAAVTGGRFFRARDAASLGAIYRDIDAIEKTQFAEPKALVREWFWPCVVLALVVVLLVGWARGRARGELP